MIKPNKKKDYDYLFKVVIIGNSNVGKSSLLMRFADDQYRDSYIATIGVDFVTQFIQLIMLFSKKRFKTIEIDSKNIKLQIWDTAGQERFRTITSAYYKGASGIILVYDKTSKQSFEDIKQFWMNEVESYGDQQISLMLLENKSDLEGREISNNEALVLQQIYVNILLLRRNMLKLFFETSAKTAESVDKAFYEIAKQLVMKREESRKKKSESNNISQVDSIALAPVAVNEDEEKEEKLCNC